VFKIRADRIKKGLAVKFRFDDTKKIYYPSGTTNTWNNIDQDYKEVDFCPV